MTVREICLEGASVLRQVAEPVVQFDRVLADLVRDMFDTMYDAPGRGLAAPQVGVSLRAFVIDIAWKEHDPDPMCFVNPRIAAQSSVCNTGEEACLSIPDRSFAVSRPNWVDLVWVDLKGAAQSERFEGVQAVCVCHELDHLNGVLITQSGTQL